MSWLTDLAGKAEQLLNKVDQTAAVALKSDDANLTAISSTSLKGGVNYHVGQNSQMSHQLGHATSYSSPSSTIREVASHHSGVQQSPTNSPKSPSRNTTDRKTASIAKAKLSIDDDQLFEFLNSAKDPDVTSKLKGKGKAVLQENRPSVTLTEMKATTSSANDKLEAVGNSPLSESVVEEEINKNSGNNCDHHEASSNVEKPKEMPYGGDTEVQRLQQPQTSQSQTRLSSLEFENGVLKNEIASINQEFVNASQKIKTTEIELQQCKKRLEQYTSQQLMNDKLIRDVDLKQTLGAKDSQLAVLRVRLQEADQELKMKRELVEKLQVDNLKILEDHTSSSGLHNQAILTVQERLQQSEEGLDRERQSFRSTQNESLQRISRLEEELKEMVTNYTITKSKHSEEKMRNGELISQLKTAKHNVNSTQQELADYKVKAQRILQSKEKLIATLKESGMVKNGEGDDKGNTAASAVELEELRQERDLLKDELLQVNQQLTNYKVEAQELESQLQDDIDTARQQYREIEESLREERDRKKDLEQELIHLKEEARYLNDDYTRQRMTLNSRIQERDGEIEKLRKQLVSKQVNTTSQTELESRLNALTESLIQKQTTLEVLSTEKSSLVFQLERLEKQLKEQTAYARRTTSMTVNVAEDNDVKLRVPGFMVETPFDNGVARKVKRVYNTIDTLSIRLGVFLRRYPIARIFVIAYMVLLHFWVMVVLLTYTPEMHDANELQKPK